eukprot:s421_g2.t1
MDRNYTGSSDLLTGGVTTTTATSQFRLRLQEDFACKPGIDSGCNITEFLKTRKFLRMWERLRYGICEVAMQKMLEQRQGTSDSIDGKQKCIGSVCSFLSIIVSTSMDAVYLSSHRLREKARRLRDIIGQHKYLVEPCNFSAHFVCYLKNWVRHDKLFQWKPAPAEFRNASDISGCGLSKGRLLWAYAMKLVLQSIHPTYFWTSLAWINMRRAASMRQALFEALSARTVDQERVEASPALPLHFATASLSTTLVFSQRCGFRISQAVGMGMNGEDASRMVWFWDVLGQLSHWDCSLNEVQSTVDEMVLMLREHI